MCSVWCVSVYSDDLLFGLVARGLAIQYVKKREREKEVTYRLIGDDVAFVIAARWTVCKVETDKQLFRIHQFNGTCCFRPDGRHHSDTVTLRADEAYKHIFRLIIHILSISLSLHQESLDHSPDLIMI